MIYSLIMFLLGSIGSPSSIDSEREQVPFVIEQIDAVLGMRDACIAPKYKNDFLCSNILDRAASCKAVSLNTTNEIKESKGKLYLEQLCFDYQRVRRRLKQSNRKCCPTSLSCQKYEKLNRYTYSYPLFCKKGLKALVFVQSDEKYEQKSGELFILIKENGEWKVDEIIEYYKL